MGKVINLFMWEYQDGFRVTMEYRAQETIKEIAPTLIPRALLVGIRTPEKKDSHKVCVEPENDDWEPSEFFNCYDQADAIYKNHPEHTIIYGDEPSMRDQPEKIRRLSVLQAVKEVMDSYDSDNGTSTFCGYPTRVKGYHAVPVLQFDRSKFQEYPRLDHQIQYDRWKSSIGFLESVIEKILELATDALSEKDAGRYFLQDWPDTAAVLRKAGAHFCGAITCATGDIMLQEVFDTLNVISSLPYEGADAVGTLAFRQSGADSPDFIVEFENPVSLRRHKLARKIIEMCGENLCCVYVGEKGIVGLCESSFEDVEMFVVSFVGHYRWALSFEGRNLMISDYGVPKLPAKRLKEDRFRSIGRRVFPHAPDASLTHLWDIVSAAIEQRKGTLIVISGGAEREAERLSKQSLGINPIRLEPKHVERVSGIDGAILIDPNGMCSAIGVILDGEASTHGDMSRGARYNSALRYQESRADTMCIVVSEDGYVDLLPDLKPQIRRGEIKARLDTLCSSGKEGARKAMNWLDKHRFYLTEEECAVANREFKRIHEAEQSAGEMSIVYPDFVPDPAMIDSYYLPEED